LKKYRLYHPMRLFDRIGFFVGVLRKCEVLLTAIINFNQNTVYNPRCIVKK